MTKAKSKLKVFKIRIPIVAKLIGMIIPSICLVLFILAYIAQTRTRDILLQEKELLSISEMKKLDLYMNVIANQYRKLSNDIMLNKLSIYDSHTLSDFLGDNSTTWDPIYRNSVYSGITQSFLRNYIKMDKHIKSIQIIRDQDISFGDGSFNDTLAKDNQMFYTDLTAYKYMKDLSESEKGLCYWVELHDEEYSTSPIPVFTLARWCRMNGRKNNSNFHGILLINLKPTLFNDLIESMQGLSDDGTQLLIMDHKGNRLAQSVDSKQMSNETYQEQELYQKIMEATDTMGTFSTKDYFVAFNQSKISGWITIQLSPMTSILGNVKSLSTYIFTVGVLLLIAISIAMIIMSINFSNVIKRIIIVIKRVEKGDFTVKTNINRRDEFGELCDSFDAMINNVKGLILASAVNSEQVYKISNDVMITAEKELHASKEVSAAIESVAIGLQTQVGNVNDSLGMIENLNNRINEVIACSSHVKKSSMDANHLSENGVLTIEKLMEKSKAVEQVIKDIMNSIEDLGKASTAIGEIVNSIALISEATNLLSLNSSIEAARAGEAGKGFAVVASEIRKLSAQSAEAGRKITQIINEIKNRISAVKEISKHVHIIHKEQIDYVDNTTSDFNHINQAITNIEDQIYHLSQAITEMDSCKGNITKSIKSIASVAEQSASATEEITASTAEQEKSMEKLSEYVSKLNLMTDNLNEKINTFNT